MPDTQTHDTVTRKKGRWDKRLLWMVGGLAFVVLVMLVAAKFWVVDAVIRRHLVHGLSRFWDGAIEVARVDADRSGFVSVRGIALSDKSGRQWLRIDAAKLTLSNWPSLSPVVTEVQIDGLSSQIFVAAGKFTAPFRRPAKPQSDPKKRYLDIHRLTVKQASIKIMEDQVSTAVYDDLLLSATRDGVFYNFSVKQATPQPVESFVAEGRINSKTLQADVSLQVKRTVKKAETAIVLSVLNWPNLSAEGGLTADLTIYGSPEELKQLQAKGTVELADWTVALKGNLIADSTATVVKLNGRRFDFENVTANVCNGRIDGSFYAELKQDRSVEFGGQISAKRIDLPQLTAVTQRKKNATKGVMTLKYEFAANGKDWKNLQGSGQIFLDDADVSLLPLIPHIFRAIGLSNYDPLTMSDAEATFATAGPIVTIKTGHITNRFAAIEAEPGGTIDLKNERLEMHVVAIPLKELDALLRRLPVVSIVANLRDKLTRLHVRGNWSDPPNKLITKEPIKDIRDGTVGFLQDVVKSGGQLTQGTLARFGILFQTKQDNKK